MYDQERHGSLALPADDAPEVRARAADGTLGHLAPSALHQLVQRWLRAAGELEALGAGLLAAWDAQRVWDPHGARSGRAWLTNTAHLAHAGARLRVAVHLAQRCPKVHAALVSGQVAYPQAAVIAGVVTDELAPWFEPVEEQVVAWAATSSAREVRVVMARWRVLAENLADLEPDERRHHERHARVHETLNGMVAIDALLDAEAGHAVMVAIDHVAERLRRDDQAADEAAGGTDPAIGTGPAFPDRRRSPAQRRADALALLVEAGAQRHDAGDRHPGGPQARLHLFLPWQVYAAYLATRPTAPTGHAGHHRSGGTGATPPEVSSLAARWAAMAGIPHTAIELGERLFGEPDRDTTDGDTTDGDTMVAEASDGGAVTGVRFGLGATFERLDRPVDPPALERLLCDYAMSRLVLDAQGVPLDLGRAVRSATPAQRVALAVRDGECAFPDCHLPPHLCHAHHLWHWEHHGPSNLDNLVLVCPHHHRRLHRGAPHRWSCRIDPTTRRPVFTPPDRSPPLGPAP